MPVASPSRVVGLVAGAAALLGTVGAAAAAPTISGTNADVWNLASPVPTYVVTGSGIGDIAWSLQGAESARGGGPSPLTVRLEGLGDGSYRLRASQALDGASDRRFRVDLTPPRVTVRVPAAGASYAQDSRVVADYSCDGDRTCVGDLPDGARIDTSRPGPATFTVRAVDASGNPAVAEVGYTIAAAPTTSGTPAPAPPPAAPVPTPEPPAPAPPAPAQTVAPPAPRTLNARLLKPRAGAVLTGRRPLLRWRARRGALLYNAQVYRVRGTRVVKVLSKFPRGNRLRVPRGRLAFGTRYIWRVWPYMRNGYPPHPIGMSWFQVRPAPAPGPGPG
jgi:hypothetical protein